MNHTLHAAVLLLACSLALPILAGCSFDYQQAAEVEETEHPDFILEHTTYTVSRSYTDPITFTAGHAEFFSKEHSVYLTEVTFEQKDADGKVIVNGSSDSATIDTDTNDTVLDGNIMLYSQTEEIRIATDTLYWDHEDQLLSSPSEVPVSVTYDDGSVVSGYGFSADFTLRAIEFAKETQGVVQYE